MTIQEQLANATHAYAAICPTCGAKFGAMIDIPATRKDTAANIAAWIRKGYNVQRLPLAEVEGQLTVCRCK